MSFEIVTVTEILSEPSGTKYAPTAVYVPSLYFDVEVVLLEDDAVDVEVFEDALEVVFEDVLEELELEVVLLLVGVVGFFTTGGVFEMLSPTSIASLRVVRFLLVSEGVYAEGLPSGYIFVYATAPIATAKEASEMNRVCHLVMGAVYQLIMKDI